MSLKQALTDLLASGTKKQFIPQAHSRGTEVMQVGSLSSSAHPAPTPTATVLFILHLRKSEGCKSLWEGGAGGVTKNGF